MSHSCGQLSEHHIKYTKIVAYAMSRSRQATIFQTGIGRRHHHGFHTKQIKR